MSFKANQYQSRQVHHHSIAMARRKKSTKSSKKTKTKKSKKSKKSKRSKGKKKRRGNPKAFGKKLQCDPALADVIGVKEATRAQIVKKIWAYVKAHKLQDPSNGRFFKPDAKLAKVMGRKGVRMNGFKMGKFINKHAY